MKTLYVVTADGLETMVAWGKEGIEEGLRILFDAQILDIKTDRDGDLKIKAMDSFGALPELTAEPHKDIFGSEQ